LGARPVEAKIPVNFRTLFRNFDPPFPENDVRDTNVLEGNFVLTLQWPRNFVFFSFDDVVQGVSDHRVMTKMSMFIRRVAQARSFAEKCSDGIAPPS
jgi:hypothetical protein